MNLVLVNSPFICNKSMPQPYDPYLFGLKFSRRKYQFLVISLKSKVTCYNIRNSYAHGKKHLCSSLANSYRRSTSWSILKNSAISVSSDLRSLPTSTLLLFIKQRIQFMHLIAYPKKQYKNEFSNMRETSTSIIPRMQ